MTFFEEVTGLAHGCSIFCNDFSGVFHGLITHTGFLHPIDDSFLARYK